MRQFKDEKEKKAYARVYDAFTNNGEIQGEDSVVTVSDLVTSPDVARFIPQVVEQVVREALEPNLVIVPNLFQEVRLERGSRVQIGALGALTASEVAEGGEYKENDMQMDGGDMVAVTVSKHGLMIRVTDEMISDNQFDVIGLWLRAAGRALARHKEQYAMRKINEFGIDIFNNTTPANAMYGSTSGRDITGAGNGSMTPENIWDMYAELLMRGFTPDTVLMHPLAWRCFMSDPEMREQVLNGATVATRQMPAGSTTSGWGTSHNGYGLRTQATGATTVDPIAVGTSGKLGASAWVNTLNALGATMNIAPKFLPGPLQVLVTPYVVYTPPATAAATPYSGRTTITMVDSSRCGVLVTRDPVSTEEFDDPARDIRALKIKERYGFAALEQGKSVVLARNVAIAKNYVFENANNVTLGNLNPATAY
ncbi:MAG TPA: hypothetical protein VI911_11020 [Patescibacteria group bacterium]|nr:hypothetical protein [Patescibacteria group bacterium]